MLRIENRLPADIEKVIKFSQQDDFWKLNILSADKLRKQYDKLFIKMKAVNGDELEDWATRRMREQNESH